MYKTTLSGQVWRFDSLKTLMAKASPARSGDALAGEGAAQRFLLSLPRRHPLLLIEQVRMAQAEGSLVAGHPLQLMIFIMGSVGLPLVIAGSGRQLGWLPPEAAPFLSQIDNPEAARQRLAWALRGLRRTEGDPA